MTKIMTDRDWEEIWEESRHNGTLLYESNQFEQLVRADVPDIGNCYDLWIELRNGLSLSINRQELNEDVVYMKDILDDYQFGLSFFLSGNVKINRHGLTGETEELVGKYYSECNYDIKETEWWQAGETFSRIYIKFDPKQFFPSFGEELLEQIPTEIHKFIINGKSLPYYHQGKITHPMRQELQNILYCPYQGLMKRMYLESRAVDLITLHLKQFQNNNCDRETWIAPNHKNVLTKDGNDFDRIDRARQILLANLENPPSLIELARQVGLNDFKLKRGFREFFGTSAFKYLHDYRLDRAKQLLAQEEMKIEEVALRVGFESRSYFAIAFRKKFGVNPKQYRQSQQKFV
jgi:AraC family transcriptional regulator, transcriptional activator of the genes for pyochelin and ferripyochelin receptors